MARSVGRPAGTLRRYVTRKGLGGGGGWAPIAMILLGQGSYLRARAFRSGAVEGKPYWRLIGAMLVLQAVRRRLARSPAERLSIQRLEPGHSTHIAVSAPDLRAGRRERRRRLGQLRTAARADAALVASTRAPVRRR
jgi:hypothetical protein